MCTAEDIGIMMKLVAFTPVFGILRGAQNSLKGSSFIPDQVTFLTSFSVYFYLSPATSHEKRYLLS